MRKPRLANTAVADNAAPADDLAQHVGNRQKLAERKADLDAAAAAAVAIRRDTLINGAGAAACAETERECREAEGAALAAADALAEVDRRIAETEATIAAAELQAQREATACALEHDADAITKAATGLTAAVVALADAHLAMVSVISDTAAAAIQPKRASGEDGALDGFADYTPETITERVTLAALVAAIPEINIIDGKLQWPFWAAPVAVQASEAAVSAEELASSVRKTAALVRSGQAPPVLTGGSSEAPAPNAETTVCVTAPFFYSRGVREGRHMVTPGLRALKVPVADLAIERGLATRDLDAAKSLPGHGDRGHFGNVNTGATTWDECADLQFDLAAWTAEATSRFNNGLPVAA